MFMGPLTMSKPWATQGIVGIHRFLEKVWGVAEKPYSDLDIFGKLEDENLIELRKLYAKTVEKVTNDTDTLNFNTAISQMMIATPPTWERNFGKSLATQRPSPTSLGPQLTRDFPPTTKKRLS